MKRFILILLLVPFSATAGFLGDFVKLGPFSGGISGICREQKPVVVATPTDYAFGNQSTGTTRSTNVALTNSGNAALTDIVFQQFSSVVFTHSSSATSPCGTTLAAKATCYRKVNFTPAAATVYSDALTISSNQLDDMTVGISGSGAEYTSWLINQEYEAGETYAGWTSAGSTPPVIDSTANVLRGSRSLRLTDTGTDATFTSPTFVSSGTIHAAMMVSFTDVATASTNSFFRFRNGTTVLASLNLLNSQFFIGIGTRTSPGYNVVAGTPYWIWLDYTPGTGTNGICTYYVSTTGTKPASPTYSITNGESTANVDNVARVGRHSTNPNSVDFDHVLVQSITIGDRN